MLPRTRWLCAFSIILASASAPALAQDADGDGVPDGTDLFPCDATASAVSYAPAQGTQGTILFEDLWPEDFTDLDYNDIALAYHYEYRRDALGRVTSLRATFDVLALGGMIENGLGLHLPVARSALASATRTLGATTSPLVASSADAELTLPLSNNLRELFAPSATTINSDPATPTAAAARLVVDITFATPVTLAGSGAPHDVYIFRTADTAHEIHRPEFAGTAAMRGALFGSGVDGSSAGRRFVDLDGLPYALVFPRRVAYPRENVTIETLYPSIVTFAASAGAQAANFYETLADPSAAFSAPTPATIPVRAVDTACVPVNPQSCLLVLQSGLSRGDGIYTLDVDGTGPLAPVNVYCDMTTDGGGWMLHTYATSPVSVSTYDRRLSEVMIRGQALRTGSSNTATRPTLPTGLTNTFNQVLFRGGNASWVGRMGTWVRFSTVASAPVSNTLSGVLTSRGTTAAWLTEIGWGHATSAATGYFTLWDAAGISPICGGANVGYGRNCPAFSVAAHASYPYHFDTSGSRELYVR